MICRQQRLLSVLVVVVLMCISDNVFTIMASKAITFRADRTITRNIRSILVNNNIISSSHRTTDALVSNSIIDSNDDHNHDDGGDAVRQSDIFAEWFRRKDSPLVILNSNPGIVSVEELDDQRYQANISPLQFPGSF